MNKVMRYLFKHKFNVMDLVNIALASSIATINFWAGLLLLIVGIVFIVLVEGKYND